MGARNVIITLGSQGSVYSSDKEPNKCVHVAANVVENVLDTTGAGDAFLGALAYHLTQYPENDFHQHIGFANFVASHSVQFQGTQTSFPNAKDIFSKLPQSYNYRVINN